MKLYVGGCFQGKLCYVLAGLNCACGETETCTVTDGSTYPLDGPAEADILNHFHLLIKRLLGEGMDIWEYTEKILVRNPGISIICDEVGMGIVPADAAERRYREEVGRCSCILAGRADCVERIVCGRGMKIK